MERIGRPPSSNPASVLRSALGGPFSELRKVALGILWQAHRHDTIRELCEELGMSRRAYESLRRDFPEIVPQAKKK